MPPIWVKPNTERSTAFSRTLEKCGVTDKEASLVLTTAFKSMQEALSKHSMPDQIDLGLFKYRLSKYNLLKAMLQYGMWLRHGVINKLYYIILVLPLRIRYDKIFSRRKLNLTQRKDDYLFMKNKYDKIMKQWLDDIKKHAKDNNIMQYIDNASEIKSGANFAHNKYMQLIHTRRKRIIKEQMNNNG